MEKYLDSLQASGLFHGIDNLELKTLLTCIGAEIKKIGKGEIVLLRGYQPRQIGIVLTGRLHITREDFDGKRSLIAAVTPGEIFAEALCCAGITESPVTVAADLDSTLLLFSFARIHTCQNSCSFHTKLISNILRLMANKNLFLQKRMEIVSLKSVRAKIMRYLESLGPKPDQEFTVPFNREEMADYLCVERSALSHELAKMKRDGLLAYHKNKFILYS